LFVVFWEDENGFPAPSCQNTGKNENRPGGTAPRPFTVGPPRQKKRHEVRGTGKASAPGQAKTKTAKLGGPGLFRAAGAASSGLRQ